MATDRYPVASHVHACSGCGKRVAICVEPDGTLLYSEDAAELGSIEKLQAEINEQRAHAPTRNYTRIRITDTTTENPNG